MISIHRLHALRSLVLVSALTILAPGSASAQNRFAQAPVYPLGGFPFHLAVADFNGDGRSDILALVVADVASEAVLATASPSGAYGAPRVLFQLPFGLIAANIVTGDFNEDGKQDFVLLLQTNSGGSPAIIQAYLGNGDGTFRVGKALSFTTNDLPVILIAGRANRDSHTDLVVGAITGDPRDVPLTGGIVHVFAGKGDGAFALVKSTTTTVPVLSMVLGDLNLDGIEDIAIHDESLQYQVMMGNGDGSFRLLPIGKLPVNSHSGRGYGQMVITDITGDGEPDLVFGNAGENKDAVEIPALYVLAGYGDGTFHSNGILYDAGNSGSALALGDLNHDGSPDLVVMNPLGSTVSVRFGSSKGPSGSVTTQYAVRGGSVFIVDANGDGRQDVLLMNDKGVQVLMSTGGGNLRAPRALNIQKFSIGLQASDLNHDGYADLAILGQVYDPVHFSFHNPVYLGLGNGSTKLTRIATGIQGEPSASGSGAHFLGLGYFNQDGNLDIATAGGVSFNNGKAQFTTYPSEPPTLGASPQTRADYNTVTGDLNHDGKADMVSAGSTTLMVSLGNGDGTFKTPVEYSLGGTDANAVMVRDINKDKNLDAITVNYGSSTVSVFLGNGDGSFKAPLAFAVSQNPLVLTTGDFNGDGKVDIAVANASNIFLLLGDGKGSFTSGKEISGVGSLIDGIVSSDLRGNGVFDLILLEGNSSIYGGSTNSVYVLYGKGDGSFATPIAYSIGDTPTAIAAGDLNGDGAPDIAVSLPSATAVPIFYNQGGTRITLTISSSSAAVGQTVTFRAVVAASLPGTGSPNGTVAFKQGKVTLGWAPLQNGAATFSTSTLNKGSHTIIAVYYGNNNFNPHISLGAVVTVR